MERNDICRTADETANNRRGKQAKRTNKIVSSWWAGGGGGGRGDISSKRDYVHIQRRTLSADFHGHYRTQATPLSRNTAKQRQYSAVATAGTLNNSAFRPAKRIYVGRMTETALTH